MSFFAELKRRNIFKVGAAYAIVAWLLIQIVNNTLPIFDAPRWALQTIIFIIILGFPISLFLAWAYELTPEGIKPTPSEGPDQYHTLATSQRLNYFILGVLVLAVGFLLIDNYVLVDKDGKNAASSVTSTNTGGVTTALADVTLGSPVGPVRRSDFVLGHALGIAPAGVRTYVALSRDGRHLVYALNTRGEIRLYHRQLNQLSTQVIPNLFGPVNPCLSPDGKWAGTLSLDFGFSKVSLQGGNPQQLVAQTHNLTGCFWTKDDVIYFSLDHKLQRIPAVGGEPEAVNITSEYAEWNQSWPYGLPDGKHLLLTVSQGNADIGKIALVSLESGKIRILIQNAYNARYVPTGHIVFIRTGSLYAVPFDLKQFKITGPEVPVINGIETNNTAGVAAYTFSADGLLAYLPGDELTGVTGGSAQLNLAWVDREGNETRLGEEMQLTPEFAAPRLSPDGKQVAVGVQGQSGNDIWIYDIERGTASRRTFSGNAVFPIWTPDGQHLVYSSVPPKVGLYWTRADGSGKPERLIDPKSFFAPYSFTPDMSQLLTIKSAGETTFDIYLQSMDGKRTNQPLLATKFVEVQPALSPDGRWLAYTSNESGLSEIYVRPFPDVNNGRWQISTGGGMEPHWRRDGKELFYLQGQFGEHIVNGVSVVAINTKSGFHPGKPETLFTGDYVLGNGSSYDVTADGQRFIMLKRNIKTENDFTSLVMVDNWFAELKRLAPPAKQAGK